MEKKAKLLEKVLFLDIEKSPHEIYSYGIRDQYIADTQIKKEGQILSFSAKWMGSKKVIYEDQSKNRNVRLDRKLLTKLWELLDQADVVITHNGDSYDIPEIFAAMQELKMTPPSSFRTIDTYKISKKFRFVSKKLGYLTNKLNEKYKKLDHAGFPGISLFIECAKGNEKAWKVNKKYNIYDTLALEEFYNVILPWAGNKVLLHYQVDKVSLACNCGSTDVIKYGFKFTNGGKFQKFVCNTCGSHYHSSKNLLTKDEKAGRLK